ncbi:MAG: hypothetical protein HY534_06585, partial [Chloroflexi bacterium]|nr:hypothetical protein [Chloroflexota bacterium]
MKKTLTIAIQREPTSFDTVITGEGASSAAGGASNPGAMVHEGLTRVTHTGERDLQLAAELPADTRGTWVINADGSMDVTWKIRSDARWHDGAPVTSADFEFAFRVRNDPESARLGTGSGAARLITSVTATGPYTFVTHWSGINIDVEAGGFNPLPKHLLESAYVANKATFGDNRYFTTEFVGAGPFKLMRWEPGSHLEFERFEGYYRGPAKISSVT